MKVMVVTGASSGIGRALALRAARAGYDVVAVGRDRERLEGLGERVRDEHGGRYVGIQRDVGVPGAAREIVQTARHAFGRIDVLVNNAGQVAVGALSAQSDEALQAQFGTHAIGPIALVREALPLLQAAHGQVFLLGSGVARVPVDGLGAYPPSKAATRSAARILRRELAPLGIAVTYVDPGAVDTPFMTRAGMAGAPPALLVTPEDVARKILLAVATRPRVLNAAPWQTAIVALAEIFPGITDLVLEHASTLVGAQRLQPTEAPHGAIAAAHPEAPSPPTPVAEAPVAEATVAEAPHDDRSVPEQSGAHEPTFDEAIEPVRRRMERVRLSEGFMRALLRPGEVLDASEVALAWAGMPNKNERAATVEVLDALAEARFLAAEGERYRVLRAAQ